MPEEDILDMTSITSKTAKAWDVQALRGDFPILARMVNGKPLVYLDNAATTQKPRSVIQSLVDYYENYNANVHRGVHTLSMEATDMTEAARKKVADFINAEEPETVIWTRNATEGMNIVAHSWARATYRAGGRDRHDPDGAPQQPGAVARDSSRAWRGPSVHPACG